MLGEKDVSIFGRLKDGINKTLPEFVKLMSDKMAYVKQIINQRTSDKEDTKDEMYK